MKEQAKKIKKKEDVLPPKMRTLLKEYNDDMKRHMGALSEDFQEKVAVVAEQFSGLNDKVDKVIRVQETHTEMIGVMMEDISEIKKELKNKADKIEVVRLDRRVRALEHVVR